MALARRPGTEPVQDDREASGHAKDDAARNEDLVEREERGSSDHHDDDQEKTSKTRWSDLRIRPPGIISQGVSSQPSALVGQPNAN
jgi:hypothetical protein